MSYLLVFLTLSLIITLHELGHLLAAKWVGIPIKRFSVGFGPKLWGFKMGGTEYWLSAIPCGGYVMPDGEDAFERVSGKGRIVFSLGGPVANIVAGLAGLAVFNAMQLGFSMHAVLYLPVEQVCRMAMQFVVMIPSLFTQPEHLSGIVGIVAGGGGHVGLDLMRLLQFFVVLNLNLALFNLLPFPPLDGGKIVMAVLRGIYRPLRRLEVPLSVGGALALIGLLLYATVMDIARVAHGAMG
jgi:regulator of sigma E protease